MRYRSDQRPEEKPHSPVFPCLCRNMEERHDFRESKNVHFCHLKVCRSRRGGPKVSFVGMSVSGSGQDGWLLIRELRPRASQPHRCAAPMKTTLSFQNLEAALPPGIPAGRRSSSRYASSKSPNWRPLVQFGGRMDGAHGGIVRFGCNLSLIGRGLYFAYVRGHEVKRAPNIAIPSCGPAGPACPPKALASASVYSTCTFDTTLEGRLAQSS
jgi:hypothetical protein